MQISTPFDFYSLSGAWDLPGTALTNILIVYSTVDGHTRAICQRIADVLIAVGNQVSLESAQQCPAAALDKSDKLVIGASIRYGKYQPAVVSLVKA